MFTTQCPVRQRKRKPDVNWSKSAYVASRLAQWGWWSKTHSSPSSWSFSPSVLEASGSDASLLVFCVPDLGESSVDLNLIQRPPGN